MNNHIIINKYNFCFIREVEWNTTRRTGRILPHRLFATRIAHKHGWRTKKSVNSYNSKRTSQAIFDQSFIRRVFDVQKMLKYMSRKSRPNISLNSPPVFLKQSPELGLLKPKSSEICIVLLVMFTTAHTLKIFVVQPIDICMCIGWIS